MKCLQRGRPACPELYAEAWDVTVPQYAEVSVVDGTSVLQYTKRMLVSYEYRRHLGLQQCLLGLGHDGGHLSDTRHGRVRWSLVEEDDDG